MKGIDMSTKVDKVPATERYRRMFLPADALREFLPGILDESACRLWILKRLHKDDPTCPGCGAPVPEKSMSRFWDCARIRCNSCGKFYTSLTDTFIASAHLSFQEIFLLSVLLAIGVSDRRVAEIMSLSVDAIRIWRKKFLAIEQLQIMYKES
jgi:transposase-like protein